MLSACSIPIAKRFGGLTAFSRSPAQGTTSNGGKTVHD
jgi:hypothetical protein